MFRGIEADSLDKKSVQKISETVPDDVKEVLRLYQQLSKSSVRKYTTMLNAVCEDGRARGMFSFYGANRTGRWAGRIIQLQNLPQNHLPDLDLARKIVKTGDEELLDMEKEASQGFPGIRFAREGDVYTLHKE